MKKSIRPGLAALLLICASPVAAHAGADVSVTPAMQSCSTNADCTIADGQCGSACSFLPVNAKYTDALKQQKASVCGANATSEAACVTRPVLTAACINSRCTLGSVYQEHGSKGDYSDMQRSDAAPQTTVPKNDRYGFTAYDLPDRGNATSRTLGTMQTANR